MGTFTLGRLTLGSENAPDRWEVQGDRIKFGADIRGATIVETKFRRSQAVGLLDNADEPVVPMTWSEDPVVWDCFVRIIDVKVGTVATSLNGGGWFPAEFEVERVADNANAPLLESRLLGASRVNSHGFTNGSVLAWWAPPSGNVAGGVASVSSATRTGEDGAVTVFATNATTTTLADTSRSFQVSPANAYKSSARIELSGDGGTTWSPVMGRQLPNLPTAWRLGNDLVRVVYGGASGRISVQHHDGTQWETAKTYMLSTDSSPASIGSISSVLILRNSPEECIIRTVWDNSGVLGSFPVTVDLSVRRGSRFVSGFTAWSTEVQAAAPVQFGVYRATAETATGITGGIRANADDADGNQFVVASSVLLQTSNGGGGIYASNASATFPFMIGSKIGVGTGLNAATSLVAQWHAATGEVQRIVQR